MLNRFKSLPAALQTIAATGVSPKPTALGLKLMPWVTFVVWAALAYSLVAWALVWFKPQAPDLQVHTLDATDSGLKPLDANVLRMTLGGSGSASEASVAQDLSALSAARMRLSGVVYAKPNSMGAGIHAQNPQAMALLSVDDHAPKAFRLGQAIEPGLYVVAIEPRSVKLGTQPNGEATLSLSLPAVPGLLAP